MEVKKRIAEWGKDYPFILREFALFLASAMYEDDEEEIDVDIQGIIYESRENIPVSVWLSYYSNHRLLIPSFLQIMIHPKSLTVPINDELIESIRLLAYKCSPELRYLARSLDKNSKTSIEKFRHHLLKPAAVGIGENKMESDFIEIEEVIRRPETLFIFEVCMSCLLFYGDYPSTIYRKARQGDVDAICKLLMIDKLVIADCRIASAIHKASLKIDSKSFKKISKAFGGTFGFPSKKKAKIHIAGLIASLFDYSGVSITAPSVQKLLDSYFANNHPGELQDPDLPDSPHAFYMALKRKRETR